MKFKYDDYVIVKRGFYKGLEGKVKGIEENSFFLGNQVFDKYYFEGLHGNNNVKTFILETDLKLNEKLK